MSNAAYRLEVLGEPEFMTIVDEHADTSWLEQDIEGFAERLDELHAGYFEMVGVVCTVTIGLAQWDCTALRPAGVSWLYVKQDAAGNDYWRAEFTASLWGMESDAGDDYFNQVKAELLEEVIEQLKAYGIVGEQAIAPRCYGWMQPAVQAQAAD